MPYFSNSCIGKFLNLTPLVVFPKPAIKHTLHSHSNRPDQAAALPTNHNPGPASQIMLFDFIFNQQEVTHSSLHVEYYRSSPKLCHERDIAKVKMNDKTTTQVPKTHNKTQAELLDLVNANTKKHGAPIESYDGVKNTLFGWTDDGKGVWVLPANQASFKRFEDIAKSRPNLGQCEILELAGAEFFMNWRDSDRARAAKEASQQATEEDNGA